MLGKSIFILGSGQIGRAAAKRFASAGWAVRLGHRSAGLPSELVALGVTEVLLDRTRPAELNHALGAGAGALIDTIAYTPEHAAQLADIQGNIGAFVVISSCSVYRDDDGRTLDEARQTGFPRFTGPIAEAQPTTGAGADTYSTRKVAMEQALDAVDRPVAILRPGAIHGPGCNAPREWWFVKRALDGRARIPVAYDGAVRFHTTAAANIAELCHVAIEKGASGVFNIGDPEPPSVREIGEMIGAAMGARWEIVGLPKHPEGVVGATPWTIPRPLLIDNAKATALGYAPAVGYAETVAETCADLIERTRDCPWAEAFPGLSTYTDPWFDYAAEDAFLAR